MTSQPLPSDPAARIAALEAQLAGCHDDLTRARRERDAALDQQAAVAEVLRIIPQSSKDVQPVLNAIVQRARILAEADRAVVWRIEGDEQVRWAATRDRGLGHRIPMARTRFTGAVVRGRRTIRHHESGEVTEQQRRQWAELFDAPDTVPPGSSAFVPLLREEAVIAVLGVVRIEARPFSDKQIALLETFADQAVIAIENARLFDELQARNREQAEALEREQATAEVLRVISRSPENLDEALQAVADIAARLCRADFTRVYLRDGDWLLLGPTNSDTPVEPVPTPSSHYGPISKMRGAPVADAVVTGMTVHAEDVMRYAEEQGVSAERLPALAMGARRGGHTRLAVPLLSGDTPVGVMWLSRTGDVRPFSPREIALAETFADQAVIAIENARLFDEVQARSRELEDRNAALTSALEREQATSEVLGVIARTPGSLHSGCYRLRERAALR